MKNLETKNLPSDKFSELLQEINKKEEEKNKLEEEINKLEEEINKLEEELKKTESYSDEQLNKTQEALRKSEDNIREDVAMTVFESVYYNQIDHIKNLVKNKYFDPNALFVKEGRNALFYVESKEALKIFVEKGTNINHVDKFGSDPLDNICFRVIANSLLDSDFIQTFIDNGSYFYRDNPEGLNALQNLAIAGKKELLKNLKLPNSPEKIFADEQELDYFIKFSKARAIVGLAYSESDFRMNTWVFDILIRDRTSNIKVDESDSNLIKKIIDGEPINIFGGNKIEVFMASWINHSAYFIIESDSDNNPLKLSYCDGNGIPFEDWLKYGEAIFELSKEKIDRFENCYGSSPIEKLKNRLKEVTSEIRSYYGTDDRFFPLIQDDLGLKDDENKFKNIEYKIPTKLQKRGNCTLKSFNIVLRAVLSKIRPDLAFEIDGKPAGDGYDLYKEFKTTLITDAYEVLEDVYIYIKSQNTKAAQDQKIATEEQLIKRFKPNPPSDRETLQTFIEEEVKESSNSKQPEVADLFWLTSFHKTCDTFLTKMESKQQKRNFGKNSTSKNNPSKIFDFVSSSQLPSLISRGKD